MDYQKTTISRWWTIYILVFFSEINKSSSISILFCSLIIHLFIFYFSLSLMIIHSSCLSIFLVLFIFICFFIYISNLLSIYAYCFIYLFWLINLSAFYKLILHVNFHIFFWQSHLSISMSLSFTLFIW